MTIAGVLVADPVSGTAIRVDPSQTAWGKIAGTTVPVMWSPGFKGRRRGFEVEVLRGGEVVVTTGTHVVLETQFEGGIAGGAYSACGGRESQ
jgi:hypothetical protein